MATPHSIYGKHVAYDQVSGQLLVDGTPVSTAGLPPLDSGAEYWWVDSGVDASDGRSRDAAVGSIAELFSGSRIASGDVILVLPGHSEDIASAAGLDIDVNNVTVIGLTGGAQPQITFSATGSTLAVSGTSVHLHNLNLEAQNTSVAKGIDAANGADDLKITGCRFSVESGGTDEFEDAIFVTTCDRVVLEGNTADMGAGTAASWAHFVGACVAPQIRGNTIMGDYSVACIEGVTSSAQIVLIEGNTLVNGVHGGLNTVACISVQAGTTGFIQDNRLYTAVTNAETAAIVAAGCFLGNNPVSTTAQTPPVNAELLGRGRLEVTAIAGIELNDEGEASCTFAVNGPVDLYGVYGVVTTACDETEEITLSLESGTTLMALGEVHGAVAAGDVIFGTAVGAAAAVDEVGTAEQHIWSNPLRVTGTEDLIDMLAEGDADGGGAATLYVVWSPVVAGAEVAAS